MFGFVMIFFWGELIHTNPYGKSVSFVLLSVAQGWDYVMPLCPWPLMVHLMTKGFVPQSLCVKCCMLVPGNQSMLMTEAMFQRTCGALTCSPANVPFRNTGAWNWVTVLFPRWNELSKFSSMLILEQICSTWTHQKDHAFGLWAGSMGYKSFWAQPTTVYIKHPCH